MGTTGSGRFDNYPGGQDGSGSESGAEGGGGDTSGFDDGSGQDICEKAIGNISLEEVGNLEYFINHESLPANGSPITLRRELEGGRLAVENESGELLGYLPTKLNYLRRCMEQGFSYGGHIMSSDMEPIPSARIDIGPQ